MNATDVLKQVPGLYRNWAAREESTDQPNVLAAHACEEAPHRRGRLVFANGAP